MEKAQEILFHIDELYTENPSEEVVIRKSKENPTRYQAWVDAFKDYDLSDVLLAIDSYWEYKNSKTKPNVAQIKAILNSRKVEKNNESEQTEVKYIPDFAITRMNEDIRNGVNRHLLTVYKLAYDYCITDLLLQDIPLDEWKHMSEYQKHMLAVEKGILGNFDDVLVYICEKYYGKKYQYPSAAMLKGIEAKPKSKDFVSVLATHWRDE